MTDYKYPGVYIQEVASGPGPITGVSTSNLGLIGFSPKGPVNQPILSASFPEHSAKFGSFSEKGIAGHEAYAFFANGGQALYFVRVTAPDAANSYWDLLQSVEDESLGHARQSTGIYEFVLDHAPVDPTGLSLTFPTLIASEQYVFISDEDGVLSVDADNSGASAIAAGGSGSIDLNTGQVHVELGNPTYYHATRYSFNYDTEVGGPFTAGEAISWASGAGILVSFVDAGVTGSMVIYVTSGTVPGDGDTITGVSSGATADVDGSVTATNEDITIDYDYRVFRFQMAWPGEAGNHYRVRLTAGSDDYLDQETASWSRFTVLVEEDVNQDATNRAWVVRETWADLVFDDSSSPAYVATVINADGSGSSLIEVVDYGNGMNPSALEGTQVTNEALTNTPAYDGATKQFAFQLANAPFPQTLDMDFQFMDGVEHVRGVTTNIAAGQLFDSTKTWASGELTGKTLLNITQGWSASILGNGPSVIVFVNAGTISAVIGDEYIVVDPSVRIGTGTGAGVESVVSPGSAAIPAQIVPGSVSIKVTMSVAGVQTVVDDGAGNLVGDPSGGGEANVGTINYTTGQITGISGGPDLNKLDFEDAWPAETVVAGSPILLGCIYAQPVALEADADGNIAPKATQATGYPQKFELNSNGTNTVNNDTGDVTLTWQIAGNPAIGPAGVYEQTADYYTNPAENYTSANVEGIWAVLSEGTDGSAVTSADLVDPTLAADQEGIYSFGKVNALMQLVAADFQTDTYVADALVTYAELVKDKFVLLTVPHGLTYQEAINWKRFQLMIYSSYAALYFPHIKVLDPISGVNLDIPVGGHVAGIYARTDAQRNVGEAPAGMAKGAIRWSTGLEQDLTETQVGFLNEQHINSLVQWDHTGRVVWGARTLDAAGGEFPYIQQRRTFMYVEKSVFNATHIHVFENNGPSLWNKIRTQVATFLQGLFTSGYLAGETAEEAYFVICDSTNNNATTRKQGLVFCDVGIATNTPAEFIVFRFQQKALAEAA